MSELHKNARLDQDLLERAAEYRFQHLSCTWADVAEHVGKDVATVYRWRQTEQWEIARRTVAERDMDVLIPAAKTGLLKALLKGDGKVALEVLRGAGFIKPETLNINSSLDESRNVIKDIINELSASKIDGDTLVPDPEALP